MAKIKSNPSKISELIPDDKNFNIGTEYGNQLIEKSFRKFGAGRSILIDKNNRIIAGNKSVENAVAIGLEDVQVVESDGKRIIAVKRTDIDLDSPEGRELALADNATAKANIVFDAELLEAEVGEAVAEEWGVELPKSEIQEDGFDAEPPLKPITVLGDVYELNQHRFTCGDSTDATVVEKTLAGAKPILMVTDPPYGVNYDPDWRNHAFRSDGTPIGGRAIGTVKNDHQIDWSLAFTLFSGEVVYVWHSGRYAKQVHEHLENSGFDIIAQLIWAKNGHVIGRGDYHFQHEPCWYAVRKGKKHNWQRSRSETSLWQIDRNRKNETGHSTQKPIECMARPIRNNTYERESVYDPFLGSGTTIIAADQLNRACYGQEIDPAYCDIIVARFIKYKRAQSSATEITVKRNGNLLSEKDIQKYLAQIDPK